MDGRSGDASALLGMDGFVVLAQTEEDGELFVLVETTADVASCPSCGVRAAVSGRPGLAEASWKSGTWRPGDDRCAWWRKRRWICLDPDREKRSFSEESVVVEGSLTRRAAKEICRRVTTTAPLGIDEHKVLCATKDHHTLYATSFVDVTPGQLLDVVRGPPRAPPPDVPVAAAWRQPATAPDAAIWLPVDADTRQDGLGRLGLAQLALLPFGRV